MDTQIINYSFNQVTKRIIFLDFTTIALERIRFIANVSQGKIIYSFVNPLKLGTVEGNVLTLACDTSTMSETDYLQIVYNTEDNHANEATQDGIKSLLTTMKRLLKMMESNAFVDILGRQRIAVENTVITLPASYPTTGGLSNTVTNGPPTNGTTTYWQPVWSGPIDPRWTNIQNARIAYNTGIRSKIVQAP